MRLYSSDAPACARPANASVLREASSSPPPLPLVTVPKRPPSLVRNLAQTTATMPTSSISKRPAGETGAVDVVLFGWADCQPTHVAKYSSLYPAGSNTLVVPSKMADFFLRSTLLLAKSAPRTGPALDFLRLHGHLASSQQALPHQSDPAGRRPLILHCFSNGGVQSLLSTLLAASLAGHHLARPIAGLILDSTPIPRASDAVHETAVLLTMSLPVPRVLRATVRKALYAALLVVDVVVHRWLGVRPRLDANCDALLAHPDLVHVPKLVLYSSGDQLVRPWHVEKFLDMLTPGANELVEVKVLPVNQASDSADMAVAYSVVHGQTREHSVLGNAHDGVGTTVDRSKPHGGLVSVVRFPKDSPHVQHLRKYPVEYQAAVSRFLETTC